MTKYIHVLLILLCTVLLSCAQSSNEMQFIPATDNYAASVNIYTPSGELTQYYMSDGKWKMNPNVPSPKMTISGSDYRFQYLSGTETLAPMLFAYSAESGEFQFFSLVDKKWQNNKLLSKGKASFSSKNLSMEFVPGHENGSAYITAYASDKKEISVLAMTDNKWSNIEYFPKKVN